MTAHDVVWTEQDWREWRREREGILIYEANYGEKDAVAFAKTLEALERLYKTNNQKELGK